LHAALQGDPPGLRESQLWRLGLNSVGPLWQSGEYIRPVIRRHDSFPQAVRTAEGDSCFRDDRAALVRNHTSYGAALRSEQTGARECGNDDELHSALTRHLSKAALTFYRGKLKIL